MAISYQLARNQLLSLRYEKKGINENNALNFLKVLHIQIAIVIARVIT